MKVVTINNLKINTDETVDCLPDSVIQQATDFILGWRKVVLTESSWIGRNFFCPSLAVSFDFYVQGKEIIPMAINPNPVGLGLASLLNAQTNRNLRFKIRSWPKFWLAADNLSETGDMSILFSWMPKERLLGSGGFVWPQLKNTDPVLDILAPMAVCPVFLKGDNSYGVNLGWWHTVSLGDYDQLDWRQGFYLLKKQDDSSRLEIWHPQKRRLERLRVGGASTRSHLWEVLSQTDEMYYRVWEEGMGGLYRRPRLYRLFFLYNVIRGQYEPEGGLWLERSNLRVREASDSLIGPLII